ncbi:MAG: hypothetical protein KDC85_02675 [Saprospiraceae bacterium]|nr:hypothetical protein [Bacteroidota bacterium]MCB0650151.1 hypothetical protein [Saprospiraceae bacterium]MCB9277275.1 hypothetical protein [Lewinellaceae bacterium]
MKHEGGVILKSSELDCLLKLSTGGNCPVSGLAFKTIGRIPGDPINSAKIRIFALYKDRITDKLRYIADCYEPKQEQGHSFNNVTNRLDEITFRYLNLMNDIHMPENSSFCFSYISDIKINGLIKNYQELFLQGTSLMHPTQPNKEVFSFSISGKAELSMGENTIPCPPIWTDGPPEKKKKIGLEKLEESQNFYSEWQELGPQLESLWRSGFC